MIRIAAPNACYPSRLFRSVLLILAVGVVFPVAPAFARPPVEPAAPQSEITLTATADATLDRASPDANFGADVRLKTLVDEHLVVTQRALLRFDLPADVLIDAARLELKLNQSSGPASVTLRAYQVAAAWSEMTVTWNNQPALGSRYADAAVGVGTGWFTWDVTAIGQAWQTEPNYGLLLDVAPPSQTAYVYRAFLSRQGEAPPRLVVTYHRPNYTLYAPASGRPGAELPVAGENFIPGTTVTLQLAQGANIWSCGSVTPDAAGVFRGRCVVPLAAAPDAAVLRARSAGGGLLAETAVQIQAGPSLQISPTFGPPGTVVNYTVTSLVAGSLRLDYAGMAIVGPLSTGGGSAVGAFVVPGDRPSPLGGAATVKATNLVGGLPAGSAEAAFGSRAAGQPPDIAFTSLSTPAGHIFPGETFTITGQIGAVETNLQDYQVTAVWRDSAGRSIPVGQPATVRSDGRFQLPARAPSILDGDAWSSKGGSDQLLLTVRKPGRETVREGVVQIHGPYTPTLEVHVATDTGADLKGVRVHLMPDVSIHGASESGQNQTNMLQETPEERLKRELEEFQCQSWWGKITGPDGTADISFDNVEDPSSNPMWDVVYENGYGANQPISGPGVAAASAIRDLPPPNPPSGPQWKHYRVTVDGSPIGYNVPDGKGGWHPYRIEVYFNMRTGDVLDAWSHDLGNPMEVVLDPIPPDQQPFDFAPLFSNGSLEPGQPPTYGTFLVFPGLVGSGVPLPEGRLGWIAFGLSQWQFDQLQSVRLKIDGTYNGSFACDRGGWKDNGVIGVENVCGDPDEFDTANYYPTGCTMDVPNANFWAKGVHTLEVVVRLKSGVEKSRSLRLSMAEAPSWFLESASADRSAIMVTSGYYLSENVITEPIVVNNPSTVAQTPETGPLANHVELARLSHDEFIYFTTNFIASGEYLINGIQALNTPGKDVKEKKWAESAGAMSSRSVGVPVVGPQSPGAPASSYRIPYHIEQELFNTGTMDMGQISLDILGVVQIAAGRDAGFAASTWTDGYIDPFGSPKIKLDVRPSAHTWGFVWTEATLLEVLGKVRAGVGYDLNLALTFGLEDYWPSLSDPCFLYNGYFKAYAGAICWPGDGCLVKKSKTVPWTPISLPPGCRIEPAPAAALEDEEDPPQIDAALASDGFGHSAALWPGDINALTATHYDGVSWSSAFTIPTGAGPTDPAVAFYAPNRALAAWAESSIPAPATPPAVAASETYTDVVRSYSIAYSTWNGAQWSPAQHLTLPTTPGTGEGKVALAACPATTAGCPAGGAVTAVWVRDVAGAPAQRQFRLYYATYQGGAWSAPQAVDPVSTATDMQPSVAYRLGQPLVAWMRDADRDANTAQDRRIAWKTLDGASGVNVPAELPGGVIALSLAVDSAGIRQLAFTRAEDPAIGVIDSRHPLYRAYATCIRTTCTWTYNKLLDSRGRAIHAEAPALTIDRLDRPTITYRALGFGPDPAASPFAYPEDTIGVTTRSGDLSQVELPKVVTALAASAPVDDVAPAAGPILPATLKVAPSYLTADGAVNWEPLASYDALSDSTIGLAVRGPLPAGAASAAAQPQRVNVATALAADQPLVVANVGRQPNLVVVTATVSARYPAPGEPLTLTVTLRNDGAGFNTLLGPLVDLIATWDGGPGLGAVAYSHAIAAPHAGQVVTHTVPLAAPPPLSGSAPAARYAASHTLTVAVNPTQTLPEQSGADNSVMLGVSGLPTPTDLTASAAGSFLVALQWSEASGGAVAGYRVYRSADGGPSLPVGSSFVTGWVDLAAEPGHIYRYSVTSYAAAGLEGAPSAAATARTPQGFSRIFLPTLLKAGR